MGPLGDGRRHRHAHGGKALFGSCESILKSKSGARDLYVYVRARTSDGLTLHTCRFDYIHVDSIRWFYIHLM